MNNGRRNRWWILAAAGAALFVLLFLAAALIGLGIYRGSGNRLTRLLDLGNRYLTEQEYEQAVAAYNRAIEIDPKDTDAYLGLAEAYERLGDVQAAQETLEAGYAQTQNADLFAALQRMSGQTGETGEGSLAGDADSEDGAQENGDPAGSIPEDGAAADLAEGEMILYFSWDGLSMGETLSNLDLFLEGTLDDGSSVRASEADKQVFASDGTTVLEIETADTGTEKSIRVKILRTDGVYHLELGDDESMRLYGDQAGLNRADLKFIVITPEGEKELDRMDYTYRYPTGYWGMELDINHGTIE